MAKLTPPKEPLVAVVGTTGTGKSDLAIDLAVRFNGEVINADAMQMYKGLPVITNQIPFEERRGIPHHLLATIDPLEQTWSVGVFKREANRLINEIRSRGKLPIVVGGTLYYIHALLFENHLVEMGNAESDEGQNIPQEELVKQFPVLDEPTDAILKRLREVDPVMADHWHPDDRRKIQRSLEIYCRTGKRASDIYAEQQQAKAVSDPTSSPWQSLVFWVHTNDEVLKERLNKRVDKMAQIGLLFELRHLHSSLLQRTEQGEVVDRTRGIWQSIGYKQMEAFLVAEGKGKDSKSLENLKDVGLEAMRAATRQYAKSQLRWMRHKSITAFKERDAMDFLYLLDSTESESFSSNVLEPAADICGKYLGGKELTQPREISDAARELLASFESRSRTFERTYKIKVCETCNMSLPSEEQWILHINGRRHRRVARKKKQTALVAVEPETQSPEIPG